MSYLLLNVKSKKDKNLVLKFAEKMKLSYKEIMLENYIDEIATSRKQIKAGKKISLKELERGL